MPRWLTLALIDIPALIVTIWYRMYVVLMALICIVTVGGVIALLAWELWQGLGWRY